MSSLDAVREFVISVRVFERFLRLKDLELREIVLRILGLKGNENT